MRRMEKKASSAYYRDDLEITFVYCIHVYTIKALVMWHESRELFLVCIGEIGKDHQQHFITAHSPTSSTFLLRR